MSNKRKSTNTTSDLMRYAGMGMQFFVSIGIAVYAGYKGDQWLHLSIPLLIWLLPLVVVCVLLYKMIKDTSKGKTDAKK